MPSFDRYGFRCYLRVLAPHLESHKSAAKLPDNRWRDAVTSACRTLRWNLSPNKS